MGECVLKPALTFKLLRVVDLRDSKPNKGDMRGQAVLLLLTDATDRIFCVWSRG